MPFDISKCPHPIALPYSEMRNETNPTLALRQLIKVFSALLKFSVIVALAEYKADGRPDDAVDREFSSYIFLRPSLGHWAGWLRVLRRWGRGKPSVLEPVLQLPQKQYKPINRAIDDFVKLRNEHVHSDWFPPAETSRGFFETFKPKLDLLLGSFDCITRSRLLLPLPPDRWLACNGPHPGGFAFAEAPHPPPGSENHADTRLYLQNRDNSLLALPIMVVAPGKEKSAVYTYETIRGGLACYFNSNLIHLTDSEPIRTLHKTFNPDSPDQTLRAATDTPADISRQIIRVRAEHWHEKLRQNLLPEFTPALYEDRHDTRQAVDKFLGSSDRFILPLVAKSGNGKTNFLCHLAESAYKIQKTGAARPGSEIVPFLIPCRHLISGEIDRFFGKTVLGRDSFSENIPSLANLFGNSTEASTLLFILDGLNEHENPKALWTAVVVLLQKAIACGTPGQWLKIIISSRPRTWKSIQDSLPSDELSLLHREENYSRLELETFNKNELSSAYKKYCKQYDVRTELNSLEPEMQAFLRDPFLLKVTFEAYQGNAHSPGAIPTVIKANDIFDSYKERKLRSRDEPFVANLLWAMWHLGKPVFESRDLDLPCLAIPPLAIGQKNQSLAYLLTSYFFSEPVYQVERVYRCTNVSCSPAGSRYWRKEALDGQTLCPACGLDTLISVPMMENDFRTPFDRLLDEDIIELSEGFIEDNNSFKISFVYDRVFEYSLGQCLHQVFNTVPQDLKSFIDNNLDHGARHIQLWHGLKFFIASLMHDETLVDLETFGSNASEELKSLFLDAILAFSAGNRKKGCELVTKLFETSAHEWIISISIQAAAELEMPEIVRLAAVKRNARLREQAILSTLTLWRKNKQAAYRIIRELETSLHWYRPVHTIRTFKYLSAALILIACEINLTGSRESRSEDYRRLNTILQKIILRHLFTKEKKISNKGKFLISLLNKKISRMLMKERNSHDQDYIGEFDAFFKRMTAAERQMMRDLVGCMHAQSDPSAVLPAFVHCATQDYMIPVTVFLFFRAIENPLQTLPVLEAYFEEIFSVVPMNPEAHCQIGWLFQAVRLHWERYDTGQTTERNVFDAYFQLFGEQLHRYLIQNRCILRSGIVPGKPDPRKSMGGGWFVTIYAVLLQKAGHSLERSELIDAYLDLLAKDDDFAADHVECMHRALGLGGEPEQLRFLLRLLDRLDIERIAPRGKRRYVRLMEFFARVNRAAPDALAVFFGKATQRGYLNQADVTRSAQVVSAERVSDLTSQRSNAIFVNQLVDKDSFLKTFLCAIIDDLSEATSLHSAVSLILERLFAQMAQKTSE